MTTVEAASEILASQYSELQPQFASYRTTTISLIEKENVRDILSTLVKGARVLEVACGSGFYTFDLLQWGALSVTAVDFSEEMIAAAKARAAANNVSNITFKIADLTKQACYGEEPFDLVFGAWPLEYAKDRPTLVQMFRNVASNLKTGGHFVCVTRVPTPDPKKMNERTNQVRPSGGGKVLIEHLQDLEDGELIRLYGNTGAHDNVSFVCIHWNQQTYESAARDGGLRGPLSWQLTHVPPHYLTGGQQEGGASLQEIRTYDQVPEYGILKVQKID